MCNYLKWNFSIALKEIDLIYRVILFSFESYPFEVKVDNGEHKGDWDWSIGRG
jgi:hypothetical protein